MGPLISLAYCGQSCSVYVPYFIPITMVQVPCRYHVRFMSYDAFTYDASFAYSRRLLQVFLDIVNRSDTISDVHFALSLTIQKIADRWSLILILWGGLSNGGEPHRIWPILWRL